MSPPEALLVGVVAPYLGLLLVLAFGMFGPRRLGGRGRAGAAKAGAANAGAANAGASKAGASWPTVDLIVPARDEAAALPATLAALERLRYPGELRVLVVDDRSRDATPRLVAAAARRDPRIELVRVQAASRRRSPKVHAVWQALQRGRGAVVMTTDADCRMEPDWVTAMARPFGDPAVVLALGPVTTHAPGEARGFRARYEAVDWLTLMLASRALARLGLTLASSANAQAYRRAAFDRVGGFGLGGRAPSGDEDLLAQRLGRLPGARTVFVDDPAARVFTRPTPSWAALLRQRRRWASRFQHPAAYEARFWAAIALLGVQSLALALGLIALPFAPSLAATLLPLWGGKLAIEVVGIHLALAKFGRPDLMGGAVFGWALLHPFVVGVTLIGSLVRPSSWQGGQDAYRRRWWRARLRRRRRVQERNDGRPGGRLPA